MQVKGPFDSSVHTEYPFLFTTYQIDKFAPTSNTYVSQDHMLVMTKCDRKWVIQKAENRWVHLSNSLRKFDVHVWIYIFRNKNCWSFARRDDDSDCPNDNSTTWHFKVKEDNTYYPTWHDAGRDFEVICEPGNTKYNFDTFSWGIIFNISSRLQVGQMEGIRAMFEDMWGWHSTSNKKVQGCYVWGKSM